MLNSLHNTEEFHTCIEDLMEDILLLNALQSFEAKACSPLLRPLHKEFFPQTNRRVLDYLDQHCYELYRLTRETKKTQGT